MNNAPDKQQRRVAGLLAQAGLRHWRTALDDLFRRYAGLEDVTIGTNEGARPEVVSLLRTLARCGTSLDDRGFAHAIAGLGFLDYRVHRVRGTQITEERWDPSRSSLAEFRAAGAITAYPLADRPVPPGLTARQLLRQVHGHGGH